MEIFVEISFNDIGIPPKRYALGKNPKSEIKGIIDYWSRHVASNIKTTLIVIENSREILKQEVKL